MNEMSLVSIGLPVFNAERTLGAAIRSVLNQTYTKWELLIIDDGSEDRSLQIAQGFHDERIRVIQGGERRGISARLNQLIETSRGKYFARMDGDDLAFPMRVAKQVSFLEVNPSIDLLGTRALVFDDNGVIKGLFPFRQTHAEICRRPIGGFYLPHPTWMGRVVWFKKFLYGGDEVNRAEDQDLLLRSYRTSTFACLDEVLLGYRQNDLPMRSILAGRRSFRHAVAREAIQNARYGDIPVVILEQFMKGFIEQVIVALGLQNRLLSHRAERGVDSDLQEQWQKIWNQCHHKDQLLGGLVFNGAQ
jgi:glycosyltransferase involved in cell wall biosynthesis